jgi:UDP-2,3-diacylglucosamine hydrolase
MAHQIQLTNGKKLYFASDFHLGVPDHESSLAREKRIVKWLDTISADAQAIYLLGDIFDFWFEYHHAIPRGFIRLQGKLAELRDKGLPIYFFTGNHDMCLITLKRKWALSSIASPRCYRSEIKKF